MHPTVNSKHRCAGDSFLPSSPRACELSDAIVADEEEHNQSADGQPVNKPFFTSPIFNRPKRIVTETTSPYTKKASVTDSSLSTPTPVLTPSIFSFTQARIYSSNPSEEQFSPARAPPIKPRRPVKGRNVSSTSSSFEGTCGSLDASRKRKHVLCPQKGPNQNIENLTENQRCDIESHTTAGGTKATGLRLQSLTQERESIATVGNGAHQQTASEGNTLCLDMLSLNSPIRRSPAHQSLSGNLSPLGSLSLNLSPHTGFAAFSRPTPSPQRSDTSSCGNDSKQISVLSTPPLLLASRTPPHTNSPRQVPVTVLTNRDGEGKAESSKLVVSRLRKTTEVSIKSNGYNASTQGRENFLKSQFSKSVATDKENHANEIASPHPLGRTSENSSMQHQLPSPGFRLSPRRPLPMALSPRRRLPPSPASERQPEDDVGLAGDPVQLLSFSSDLRHLHPGGFEIAEDADIQFEAWGERDIEPSRAKEGATFLSPPCDAIKVSNESLSSPEEEKDEPQQQSDREAGVGLAAHQNESTGSLAFSLDEEKYLSIPFFGHNESMNSLALSVDSQDMRSHQSPRKANSKERGRQNQSGSCPPDNVTLWKRSGRKCQQKKTAERMSSAIGKADTFTFKATSLLTPSRSRSELREIFELDRTEEDNESVQSDISDDACDFFLESPSPEGSKQQRYGLTHDSPRQKAHYGSTTAKKRINERTKRKTSRQHEHTENFKPTCEITVTKSAEAYTISHSIDTKNEPIISKTNQSVSEQCLPCIKGMLSFPTSSVENGRNQRQRGACHSISTLKGNLDRKDSSDSLGMVGKDSLGIVGKDAAATASTSRAMLGRDLFTPPVYPEKGAFVALSPPPPPQHQHNFSSRFRDNAARIEECPKRESSPLIKPNGAHG